MKRAVWAVPVVAVTVALLWFGFGRDPSNIPNPLVNRAAPAFSLEATNGHTIRLSSFRGRPLVVSFFASWCTACKEEEGYLVQAYRKWKNKASFLGIIYGDSAKDATNFTRSFGGTWPDLVDPGQATAINYGVTGVPEMFFINRRGTIVFHSVSLLPGVLRTGISKAMQA